MTTLVRRFWWAPLLIVLLAAGGFVAWALFVPAPMPEAIDALKSDAWVSVESGPWIVFTPAGHDPDTGFIFYPGGRVDARAYAPVARAIAAGGNRVVIAPMPLNLAVFAPDSARAVIAAYPQVKHWAVGGHSLGGAMAAAFAQQNPGAVQGLVLWAAYPAENNSLAASPLRVVSVYGTRDGLATPAKIEASRRLLPADTRFVAIEGGNHAQFGWYGPQDGDNAATISREAQKAQIVAATRQLLEALGKP